MEIVEEKGVIKVPINQKVLPRTRNFLLILKNSLGKKTIGEAIDTLAEERNQKETII